MSTYFGNGYLLNLARRSAVPFSTLRRAPTHAPPPLTEFSNTSQSEPLEVQSETSPATATGPADTMAAPMRPAISTEIETVSREDPTATQDTPHVQRTMPVADISVPQATGTQGPQPLRPPDMSPTPARRQRAQQASDAENISQRSGTAISTPRRAQNDTGQAPAPARTETFELKMPEDFFKKSPPITGFQTETETTKTEINLSPILAARSEPPAKGLSTTLPANTQPETQNESIVNPVHSEVRLKSDLHELSRVNTGHEPAPIVVKDSTNVQNTEAAAQSQTVQFVPPVSLPPEITAQLNGGALELAIETKESEVVRAGSRVEPFEAPAPMLEARLPQYLEATQPQIKPPVIESPSPARLRINRIDVQIINNVAPPAPRAAAPDMRRLLEQKHLGRVALLL